MVKGIVYMCVCLCVCMYDVCVYVCELCPDISCDSVLEKIYIYDTAETDAMQITYATRNILSSINGIWNNVNDRATYFRETKHSVTSLYSCHAFLPQEQITKDMDRDR